METLWEIKQGRRYNKLLDIIEDKYYGRCTVSGKKRGERMRVKFITPLHTLYKKWKEAESYYKEAMYNNMFNEENCTLVTKEIYNDYHIKYKRARVNEKTWKEFISTYTYNNEDVVESVVEMEDSFPLTITTVGWR